MYLCRQSCPSAVSASESSRSVLLHFHHSGHLCRLMQKPMIAGLPIFLLDAVCQPVMMIMDESLQTMGRGCSLCGKRVTTALKIRTQFAGIFMKAEVKRCEESINGQEEEVQNQCEVEECEENNSSWSHTVTLLLMAHT